MIPPGSGQEGSEIAADFPEATSVFVEVLAPGVAISEAGWFIFLRYRPEAGQR
ncbi:hypothetical protein WME94_20720 [Sorangium sp. So ce429]